MRADEKSTAFLELYLSPIRDSRRISLKKLAKIFSKLGVAKRILNQGGGHFPARFFAPFRTRDCRESSQREKDRKNYESTNSTQDE